MEKDASVILEEFRDIAQSRCAFDLKNGQHHEGYILEIRNDHIVFAEGGPFAPEEDFLISIQAIDLSTLSYFNAEKHCYVDATWNEERGDWIFKPSHPIS